MITTKLIFDRRKTASRTHEGYVEVRITIDRKTMYLSTGVRVCTHEWAAGRVVNRPDASVLNDRLAIIFEKVNEGVNESVKQDVKLDVESVKQMVWKNVEYESNEPTLLNWIEKQIPLLKIKDGTRKHYTTLVIRLTEYGKMNRWQDVTVENVMNFDAWLHALRPKANEDGAKAHGRLDEGLSDGTIYNYHKCLKALLRRAYKFDKIENNPYDKLKGEIKRGDRENTEFLTFEEMQAVMAVDFGNDMVMRRVKDLFVFQMWTGLSYSDAQAFDIGNYRKEGDTWRYVGKRIKTDVTYISQLLPPVIEVLERNDMKVPKIENHVYNRYLKVLGVAAKVNTPLHSHLARHSFATWMKSQNVPLEHVSKMLGHKNIAQTLRYAKIQPQAVYDDFEKIAEQMANENNKHITNN